MNTRGTANGFVCRFAFVALLVTVLAAPTQASSEANSSRDSQLSADSQSSVSEVPESSDDTIRVPVWIPGFDDVDPELICSPLPSASVW